MPLPKLTALRYLQPLREGGSLPAVVETEDGLYVAKFRGAGQGPRALIAEVIVGLLARELALPVPELAEVEVPPPFGAIDHGSAVYAHHAWDSADGPRTRTPFAPIREHVLLLKAGDLRHADQKLSALLTEARLEDVVGAVPDALLMDPLARGAFRSAAEARERYLRYLRERLAQPRDFLEEAVRAQGERRAAPPRRLGVRR